MASIMPPLTAAELAAAIPGMAVNVALAVTGLPGPDLIDGELLQADEAEPSSAYRRTGQPIQAHWSPITQFAMGGATDVQIGALIRVRGTLSESRLIDAGRLVILTQVARIVQA
jgi:hypothetical protein